MPLLTTDAAEAAALESYLLAAARLARVRRTHAPDSREVRAAYASTHVRFLVLRRHARTNGAFVRAHALRAARTCGLSGFLAAGSRGLVGAR